MIEVFFVGDIIGHGGQLVSLSFIQSHQAPNDNALNQAESQSTQFFVANAENATEGLGISQESYQRLTQGTYRFDILSSGNHIWDKSEVLNFIDKAESKLMRPYNYPSAAPGTGFKVHERHGIKLAVVNVLGRSFMNMVLDCPFRACDQALRELQNQHKPDIILVDIHAEANAEKIALAHYLDGRVHAVVGTHTHVQTADEQILPHHTAFITDVGCVAETNTVIGMDAPTSIARFLTGMPRRRPKNQKCHGKSYLLCAVKISLAKNSNGLYQAQNIERIQYPSIS